MNKQLRSREKPFRLEEATIDELHAAITAGETTCVGIVRHYLARVRAFNGTSNLLVTKDGEAVADTKGALRGGAPLHFPTETVKASALLPDLDKYKGPPLEFGRMESTASDPDLVQQFGSNQQSGRDLIAQPRRLGNFAGSLFQVIAFPDCFQRCIVGKDKPTHVFLENEF